MASGDTDVTICNQALTLLGSDTISSFSDTTNDLCSLYVTIFIIQLRKKLYHYPWSFALVKEKLNKSGGVTPVNEWTYQFILPSNSVSGTPLEVYNSSSTRILPIQSYELGYTSFGPSNIYKRRRNLCRLYFKCSNRRTYLILILYSF